jgi:hypothetical protein
MKAHFMKYDNGSYRFEVFGNDPDFVSDIRGELGTDDKFLTDEIILAPLHADIARLHCSDHEFMLYSANENDVKEYKSYARLCLLGSICHALDSRARSPQFADYANAEWKDKSLRYWAKAAAFELSQRLGNKNGKKVKI